MALYQDEFGAYTMDVRVGNRIERRSVAEFVSAVDDLPGRMRMVPRPVPRLSEGEQVIELVGTDIPIIVVGE